MKKNNLMKKAAYAVLASGLLFSCDKEEANTQLPTEKNINGKIEFGVGFPTSSGNTLSMSLSQKSLSSSSNSNIDDEIKEKAKYLKIIVTNENNQEVFNDKAELLRIGDDIITSPISFAPGEYNITLFQVLDINGDNLAATPMSGAKYAKYVTTPLSQQFTVTKDVTNKEVLQVISTEDRSAKDFGYSTFSFEQIKLFDFLLQTSAYFDDIKNFKQIPFSITISKKEFEYSSGSYGDSTVTFTIPLTDDLDTISITVSGDTTIYSPKTIKKTIGELKNHFDTREDGGLGSVIVILDKIKQSNSKDGEDFGDILSEKPTELWKVLTGKSVSGITIRDENVYYTETKGGAIKTIPVNASTGAKASLLFTTPRNNSNDISLGISPFSGSNSNLIVTGIRSYDGTASGTVDSNRDNNSSVMYLYNISTNSSSSIALNDRRNGTNSDPNYCDGASVSNGAAYNGCWINLPKNNYASYNGVFYFTSANLGDLFAVDEQTMSIKWSYKRKNTVNKSTVKGYGSNVVVENDKLYYGTDNGEICSIENASSKDTVVDSDLNCVTVFTGNNSNTNYVRKLNILGDKIIVTGRSGAFAIVDKDLKTEPTQKSILGFKYFVDKITDVVYVSSSSSSTHNLLIHKYTFDEFLNFDGSLDASKKIGEYSRTVLKLGTSTNLVVQKAFFTSKRLFLSILTSYGSERKYGNFVAIDITDEKSGDLDWTLHESNINTNPYVDFDIDRDGTLITADRDGVISAFR